MAPVRGDLVDLAVDHRVAPLDPRWDDVGVTRVDDGQDVERVDIELERMDPTGRVLRLADRARSEARPRPVAHGVVERSADDRDVHVARTQLGGVGDPREVHERRRPDIRRQVEVRERLERAVPAVRGGEVAVGPGLGRIMGVVGALGHGNLRRRTVGRFARPSRSGWPSRWGRRRFEPSSSGARRGRW